MKSLKTLNLSENNINFINKNMLNSLESIECLDLSVKWIFHSIELGSSTFQPMKKLKSLKLNGNKIKLTGDCFEPLKDLRELEIADVDIITSEDYSIWKSLKNLEKIKLDNLKSPKHLPAYMLSEFVHLKELSMKSIYKSGTFQYYGEMLKSKREREKKFIKYKP